jgi:hypothetical protein
MSKSKISQEQILELSCWKNILDGVGGSPTVSALGNLKD